MSIEGNYSKKIMNDEQEKTEGLNATSALQTLGVSEVSKALGVSRATILRWISGKKIDGFFRIGSKWLIRKTDFDSL